MEQTIEYKGYTIQIWHDDDPSDPRGDDNMGVMALSHKRYDVANESGIDFEDFNSWDEVSDYIRDELGGVAILPVYMYDHSGTKISTKPFSDPWDSGQLGFIYVTKETVEKEYGEYTTDNIAKAAKYLQGEVETYDAYVSGDVYGYVITNPDGTDGESCWGFYGFDYCVFEAQEQIDYDLKVVNSRTTL